MSITALEIRPEEIGTYDPARYKAIRERLNPTPRPFVRRCVVTPPSDYSNLAIDGYEAKDRQFDLGARGAFPAPRFSSSITMREIIKLTASAYNLPPAVLMSNRRAREIVRPRQEAMWLCHTFTKKSLPEIGRAFGGRDHTTVLHAVRLMKKIVADGSYEPLALPAVKRLVAIIESARSPAAIAAE